MGDRESLRKRKTERCIAYRDVGVSSVTLGVSGGEDSVDKDEGANNLSTKPISFGVASVHHIGTTTQRVVPALLETLHYTRTTYRTQALHHHVVHCPRQRQLPCQEQPKGHRWIYMPTCTATTFRLITEFSYYIHEIDKRFFEKRPSPEIPAVQ